MILTCNQSFFPNTFSVRYEFVTDDNTLDYVGADDDTASVGFTLGGIDVLDVKHWIPGKCLSLPPR